MLAFQNCSNAVGFSAPASIEEAKLSSTGTDNVVEVELVDDLSSDKKDDDFDREEDCDKEDHDSRHQAQPKTAKYICILEGSGNALKLRMGSNSLSPASHSTSKAVCISKSACLDLVSQKFDVKGIKPGSESNCAHNPNLIQLSDQEVADLLFTL